MSVSFVERTVWWVKRDFRVTDNHCLYLATQSSDEVIPFFCWEPSMLEADDFGSFLKRVREEVGPDRYKYGESSGIINGK